MQSLAAENLPHVFFNPCRPGFGLLGFGKMQKVRPLPPRLRMLRLRDQNALGILQQRALDKQKRTVCLECVNQYDVAFLKRIAGDAPLELLFEPAAEDYGSEQLQFFPPFYGFFNIASTRDFLVLSVIRSAPFAGNLIIPVLVRIRRYSKSNR